ncbi:hypothetical protein G6F31_011440 [Rhizopus arrhizus]|nr:hypothetical protein G6F31_011440 [Rhizopus arrhizus]
MFVAHRGEITGQRELGGVLAVQGVGVQAVAMPGVLQCGTLQFQRGAGCRGGRSRQQCLRQCGRGAGTEALVGVGAYATRRHRALSVGRIFGFGARGQFNHAHDLGGGGRIDEAGVTELDQCGVHLGEARIGGQQQHRGGRLLHDRIGLAIRGEQRAVGQVQADGQAVDFRALIWREYRDDGLRICLPPLERLRTDSEVDWALLHKGAVQAHGRGTLMALGQRHSQAEVLACLDPHDLILLELQLPPLTGRRLQAALQGEVEAMLLDDLQEVALAHGAQADDGSVPVAWLGQQAMVQAQQLLEACGLRLRALYPTPLLLPWNSGEATLWACGEHLLVRSGHDRGGVQWCGGRDAGAVMQALAARLQQSGPACHAGRARTAGLRTVARVVSAPAQCGPEAAAAGDRAGIGRGAAGGTGPATAGLALAQRRRGAAAGHGAAVQRALPRDHRCRGPGAAGAAGAGSTGAAAVVAGGAAAGGQCAGAGRRRTTAAAVAAGSPGTGPGAGTRERWAPARERGRPVTTPTLRRGGGLAGLQQRWQRLPPRDRLMLGVMIGALLVAGLCSFWLEPLLKQRAHWQAELPRLQAQATALAPLLRARERQQQARDQRPTLAGLRERIRSAGLAEGLHIEARDGRWHLQVQAVPADALWNWLLPVLADPAIELQQLQLTRTGDANMPAARISGNIVMAPAAGGHS